MELPSDIINSLSYINEMKENEINAADWNITARQHQGAAKITRTLGVEDAGD